MEILQTLLYQIALMFCYMAIGVWVYKKKLISSEGCGQLGKLLLYVVLPAAIVRSCLNEFSEKVLQQFLLSFILAVLALSLSILVSWFMFGKRRPIENFSAAFSNAGFIGIPLVNSVLGEEAVFLVASFIALLNILQWTYGVFIMTGKKEYIRPSMVCKNPIVLSFAAGILLFLLPLSMPEIVSSLISGIASMNGPLAMIIMGAYLGQVKIGEIFLDRRIYLCCAARGVFIPLLTALVLNFVPVEYTDIKLAILIVASAPVGSNVAIFAQMEKQDYTLAVKGICLSTILSIFTMPSVFLLSGV